MARYHNGTDLDLDETYAWGWDELHGIELRMAELAEQIVPGSSLAQCVEQLKTDPRYVVEGVDNFLAWNQDVIDRTISDLHGTYFDIPEPLRRCQSMAIPAGGPNTTYYTPPSEDFTRPGQIWHPVEGKTSFPLYEALSIAYHEGTPGHHLQLAQMMYQAESLTRFQRLAFISGHGEGWALYAERLMHELGYLDDPVYELGWLVGQALRAARVILDIGLHCEMLIPSSERFHPGERWRPELGVPFLVERTAGTTEYLASEVDRYLGIPGQAISYKVGERVFLEGRERAKRRLGEWFDLKTFHQVVLDMGAMGLDQLRDELDALTFPDIRGRLSEQPVRGTSRRCARRPVGSRQRCAVTLRSTRRASSPYLSSSVVPPSLMPSGESSSRWPPDGTACRSFGRVARPGDRPCCGQVPLPAAGTVTTS